MKKLTVIFSFILVLLGSIESYASPRETDFAPFPLSLSSESLLNGYWASEDGFLQITESDNYFINDQRWFIIYRVEDEHSDDKEIAGFIYYDLASDEYKRVFWEVDGVEVSSFVLYMREERVAGTSTLDDTACENMSVYMLKLDEEVFMRSECGSY